MSIRKEMKMTKLLVLVLFGWMPGVALSAVTTHFALDTRSGMRLVSAGSTLAVNYSPDFSTVQGDATVRVLTNGTVWVESAVAGTKGFTFGDTGIYQFTHQVLANGVVAEEMSAWYAVSETGRIDIPDTWTKIPAGLFRNCDWLTSVKIPNSVAKVGENAFLNCANLRRVDVASLEDWLKIEFVNETANPLHCGAKLYVDGKDAMDQLATITFDATGGRCSTATKTFKKWAVVGALPIAEQAGCTFDGWYTAASGGTRVTAVTVGTGDMTLYAHWAAFVGISNVKALQRDEGRVDIVVTMHGLAADVATVECVFSATNSATKAAIPVAHITRNGDDTGSGNVWTRKFIWDAKADVGAVKIDDVVLIVDAKKLGAVQLWADGPYWAECNVGASQPEEYGYYFWWGDTVGYKRNAENNGWVSVKDGSSFSFSEGNCLTYEKNNSQLQSEGYVDETGNLVAAYDAATAHLGAPWRMPTDAEFSALINNCDTEWSSHNGVPGRLIKGRGAYAAKSIFLPAAGYGNGSSIISSGSRGGYWSSTPSWDSGYAWNLCFYSSEFYVTGLIRRSGQSVRPVRGFAEPSVAVGRVTTHLSLDLWTIVATSVVAQQRYPWNGLVDIVVTMQGAAEDVAGCICSFVATNSATKTAIPVEHITRNGDDVESADGWTRKFIWNAKVDVGAVKIDDVTLTVDLKPIGGVQLWENGPYWAECNVGASKPEECGNYFYGTQSSEGGGYGGIVRRPISSLAHRGGSRRTRSFLHSSATVPRHG